jgi:GT2 family glycosyltransferase
MMNYFQPAIIDTLGLGLRTDRFGTIEFMDLAHGEKFDATRHGVSGNLIGVCAGAALYRRVFFDAEGLLDERFFAIYEDVDLSLRGIRRGWHFTYEPQAVVFHHKSPSLAKLAYRKRLETTKNYYYAAYKNLPGQRLWSLSLKLLYSFQMDLFNIVAHFKNRRYLAALGMYGAIIRHLPSLLAGRRTTISSREYQTLCRHSIEKGIW